MGNPKVDAPMPGAVIVSTRYALEECIKCMFGRRVQGPPLASVTVYMSMDYTIAHGIGRYQVCDYSQTLTLNPKPKCVGWGTRKLVPRCTRWC